MNASQIFMMPLAGAVPANGVASAASATTLELPAGESFSQLFGEILSGSDVLRNPASDTTAEESGHVVSSQAELPATPPSDPMFQQMAVAVGAASVTFPQQTTAEPVAQQQSGVTAVPEPMVSEVAGRNVSVLLPEQMVRAAVTSMGDESTPSEASVAKTVEYAARTEAVVNQARPEVRHAEVLPMRPAAPQAPGISSIQPGAEVPVAITTLLTEEATQPEAVHPVVAEKAAVAGLPQVKPEVPPSQPKGEGFVAVVKAEHAGQPARMERAAAADPVKTQAVPEKAVAVVTDAGVARPVQTEELVQVEEPEAVSTGGITARMGQEPASADQASRKTGNTQARQSTEWWSYGSRVTAPVTGAAGHDTMTANPVNHQAGAEKPAIVPFRADGTAVEAETTAGTATDMQFTAAVHEGRAADGVQQYQSSLPASTVRSETVVSAEKVVESNRPALPEQVSRQVAERLGTHDFKQGKERLSLTLNPESLGKIQMNFQMDQQNLRVEIVAENRAVREALVQQADLVKESLARQNITVEKFDIATSGERAFQQQYQQSPQQRGFYSSLYERQEGGRTVATGASGGADDYQVPEGLQYFEQQYESTFAYRA